MSLREQILAAVDTRTEAVEVPEWGVTVWVRSMTAAEQDAYEQQTRAFGDQRSARLRIMTTLIVLAAVDADGRQLFSPEDYDALERKSFASLLRIFQAITRVNAMTAADIEDLRKNSLAAQNGDSPSDSPVISAA
jgi:hypothetical protein